MREKGGGLGGMCGGHDKRGFRSRAANRRLQRQRRTILLITIMEVIGFEAFITLILVLIIIVNNEDSLMGVCNRVRGST